MFKRLTEDGADRADSVSLRVDGREIAARAGDSVAAALLAAGIVDFRVSPAAGTARGPYCLMGVCFECLVSIDGRANRQACMVPVAAGMEVRTGMGSEPA